MNLSNIQPINMIPALFLKDLKVLVIADIHIGIDSEFNEKGINVTDSSKKLMENIVTLIKKYKPKEMILLGDIKHNIPRFSIKERTDVKKFLRSISELAIVHIIPGNHDGNIKWLTPENIKIHSSKGFILKNIGFIHGHCWPKEEIMRTEQIIMGHTHPSVEFVDRLEYRTYEPCWLKGYFNKKLLNKKYPNSKNPELLVIPAFNPLCGGVAINRQGFMGPIGKIIDIENIEIYLLDGTSLGKVKTLKKSS